MHLRERDLAQGLLLKGSVSKMALSRPLSAIVDGQFYKPYNHGSYLGQNKANVRRTDAVVINFFYCNYYFILYFNYIYFKGTELFLIL